MDAYSTLPHREYSQVLLHCSGGHQLVRAYKHGRAFAGNKGLPCLLIVSRLPKSHQAGHTLEEEEEE